jgi:hypothetical protein
VDKQGQWVAYEEYQEPKQSAFWQVFDVLFILVLCYVFLLVPILLTGKVLVGS